MTDSTADSRLPLQLHEASIAHGLDSSDPAIRSRAEAAAHARRVLADGLELRDRLKAAGIETPVQQQRRLAAFVDANRDAVTSRVDRERAEAGKLLDELEGQIMGPLNKAALAPLAAEIRATLRQMPEAARSAWIGSKIRAGDANAAGAVLGAEAILSGLDDSTLKLHREAWRRTASPELSARVNAIQTAQARLEAAGDAFLRELDRLVDRHALKAAEQAELAINRLAGKAA